MLKAILAASVILGVQSASAADYSTQRGQPLCSSPDDLQTYMLAGITNDKDAKWDCQLLPPGLRLKIEEVVNKTAIGDLVKARVFDGNKSVVGYTMNIGLQLR